jgi:hypothetical protein
MKDSLIHGNQSNGDYMLVIQRRTLLRYHAWQFGLAAALRFARQDQRRVFHWRYKRKRDAIARMNTIETASAYQAGRMRKAMSFDTRLM